MSADAVLNWLETHWVECATAIGVLGSVASLAGAVLSWLAWRSAAAAADAAVKARLELVKHDAVSELTQAVNIMREIRGLQSAGSWQRVIDRYAEARVLLIKARSGLSLEQRHAVSAVIQRLSSIQEHVESTNESDLLAARLNSNVSKQADVLAELLAIIRAESQR